MSSSFAAMIPSTSSLLPRRPKTAPASDRPANRLPRGLPPVSIPVGADDSSKRPTLQWKTRSIHTSAPSTSEGVSPPSRVRPLPPVPDSTSPERRSPVLTPRPLPRTPSDSPPPKDYLRSSPEPTFDIQSPTSTSSPSRPSLVQSISSPALPSSKPVTIHAPAVCPSKRASPRVRTDSRSTRVRAAGLLTVPESCATDGAPSPISPMSPAVPPSPATRKLRSVNKLTRHLGEDVASKVHLVPPPFLAVGETFNDKASVMTLETLVFRVHSEAESTDEDESDLGDVFGVPPRWTSHRRDPSVNSKAPRTGPPVQEPVRGLRGTRESRHWFKEQKGRLVEQDYADVLHKLRKL